MRGPVLWVVAFVLGQILSFAIAELKAPGSPLWLRASIGLLIGGGLGVLIFKTHRSQGSAFDGVRLGDRAGCAALLQKRRASQWAQDLDPFGTAALEVAMGEPAAGLARLQRNVVNLGVQARMRALVEAHAALVSADLSQHAQALASLLNVGRLPHDGADRYRAYLVARAALSPVASDLLARADGALKAYKDPEVRAYLQWVRSHYEVTPFDGEDRVQDMRRGAELAGLQGLPALAAKVSRRAAALERAAAQVGPYRR